MTAEEQREAHLGHFETAEFDPTGGLPFAGPGPAVARRRRSAAGPRLKEMPDERLIGSRILALDGDAETASPAGHRAVGAGRRQGLDDRLDDLLPAVVGRQGDGCSGVGPHHRARFCNDRQRAEGAVVFGCVGVDQVGQRDDDRGIHVRVGGVDEARHLLVRVGQIDRQVAAALRYRRADVNVIVAAAVIVEQCLTLVDAVPPLGDDCAGLAFGAVEHRLDCCIGERPAEFGRQREQPPLADMRRADHRREIAAEIAWVPDIGRDHLQEIAAHFAAIVEPQRRDANAFLPNVGRGGVVGAVRRAADVALMRPVDRPEARQVAFEYRHKGGQIGQMVAAVVRVVEQENITLVDVVTKKLGHRLRRKRQGADMDRHVLGLRNQPAVEIANRGREVAARIEDLRIGGAKHRLAHLCDDRQQAMLYH